MPWRRFIIFITRSLVIFILFFKIKFFFLKKRFKILVWTLKFILKTYNFWITIVPWTIWWLRTRGCQTRSSESNKNSSCFWKKLKKIDFNQTLENFFKIKTYNIHWNQLILDNSPTKKKSLIYFRYWRNGEKIKLNATILNLIRFRTLI